MENGNKMRRRKLPPFLKISQYMYWEVPFIITIAPFITLHIFYTKTSLMLLLRKLTLSKIVQMS